LPAGTLSLPPLAFDFWSFSISTNLSYLYNHC